MPHVRSLQCPTCGAALSQSVFLATRPVCDYCGAVLNIEAPPPKTRDREATIQVTSVPHPAGVRHYARVFSHGGNLIGLIKLVREATQLGLREAKDIAESLPVDVPLVNRSITVAYVERELIALGCRYAMISADPTPAVTSAAPATVTANVTVAEKPCVVLLENCGPNKIAVIREVRELTGFGLADAKHVVDHTPSRFKARSARVTPQDIIRRFVAVGARVKVDRE